MHLRLFPSSQGSARKRRCIEDGAATQCLKDFLASAAKSGLYATPPVITRAPGSHLHDAFDHGAGATMSSTFAVRIFSRISVAVKTVQKLPKETSAVDRSARPFGEVGKSGAGQSLPNAPVPAAHCDSCENPGGGLRNQVNDLVLGPDVDDGQCLPEMMEAVP
jgi:hypothetical protein